MKLSQLTRLSVLFMLAMSFTFVVSSCGKDDSADPDTTNNTNNNNNNNPPVVTQKLTITVTSGPDQVGVFGKDVKLAKSVADLDNNNLIGTKTTNSDGVVVFEGLAPATYHFQATIANGPLGTSRGQATIEEGFDAKGYIMF